MRIPAIAALLVSLLALPGCIYIPPVWDIDDAINNVEWIKPNVTKKAQVVERLGEPDQNFGDSIRYTGKRSYGFIASQGGAMLIGERSWYVSIVFDTAGVVRSIDTSETAERRPDQMLRQERAKEAERTGTQPRCADVGGYEKYMKDTGKVCKVILPSEEHGSAWIPSLSPN